MKIKTIQFGFFLSTLIIGIIVLTQVYWLRKVYLLEQKEFEYRVARVFKSLYGEIKLEEDATQNLNDFITKPQPDIFVARVLQWHKPDSIVQIIDDRLEDFNVFTDCHVNFFSITSNKIFYEKDIHSAVGTHNNLNSLPLNFKPPPYNAIILYFPNRNKYILSNMYVWILSSLILLGVLIWLGVSIFYLQRQKSLNNLQKDFVNNFTHEFKTPLSVIALAAESLQKPSSRNSNEKLERYASMVEYQTKYLQNQIDRLLRYSFSENSQLKLIKESINIHELIEEVIDNLLPLIESKGAEVILELQAENKYLYADRNYLFIALVNLIENALKYSYQPKVIIATSNKNRQLLISVKDNGEGIEKKYLSKIFNKFFRVTKGDIHSAKGFGIGLSFVKKIIDSHHGFITVESIKGIGSNFTLALHQTTFNAKENSSITGRG